jgi:glycosyltransferase involved in cell wall biosynthesis
MNYHGFNPELVDWMIANRTYVKMEMDYGYCHMRNGMCEDCLKANPEVYNRHKVILEKASFLIFINPKQREIYRRYFGDLVNNSMTILIFMDDVEKYKDEGHQRIPNSVLYAGRLYYEKGVMNVLKLAIDMPKAKFYFIGFGLPELIVKIENIKNCIYLGSKPKEEMPIFYNMYEYFASMPEWTDTGPITIVEAMLCGMKPIANDNNGVMSHGFKDNKEIIKLVNESKKRLFEKLHG